jgi:hypothetical protein
MKQFEKYGFIRLCSVIFVSIVLMSFVFAGCSNDSGTARKTTVQRTLSVNEDGIVTDSDEGADEEVTFEVTAERGTGTPVTVTYTFTTYDSPAEMEIINGGLYEPHGEKVSSAYIRLNGEVVFRPSDFNQNVDEIEQEITLLDGENVLEVILNSIPGSTLTIVVEQEVEEELEGGHEPGDDDGEE